MKTEIQPPRALPLRVVGWLSLPWHYWAYLIGSLAFGLTFLTIAPVSLALRVVVLVVPFLIALGLAVPYGGLHAEEWMKLALKYRLRPTAAMTGPEQLKEQESDAEFDEMAAALEAGLNESDAQWAAELQDATPAPAAANADVGPLWWGVPGSAALPDQPMTSTQEPPLAGTGGIFRRRLPAPVPAPAVDQWPDSANLTDLPGFAPFPEAPVPGATPGRLLAIRQRRNATASFKGDQFLRDQRLYRLVARPVKRKR